MMGIEHETPPDELDRLRAPDGSIDARVVGSGNPGTIARPKISVEECRQIRVARYRDGATVAELASIYDITDSAIDYHANGKCQHTVERGTPSENVNSCATNTKP